MSYIDELSILADAVDFGETHAQCDINKIAEQGAVPCRVLDMIDRFLRIVSLIILIISITKLVLIESQIVFKFLNVNISSFLSNCFYTEPLVSLFQAHGVF